jgi:phosphomannomutase
MGRATDGMRMFGTSGVRGPVGDVVTAELALSIGRAVATDGASTVLVGRDARDSGRFLADAVAAGIGSGAISLKRRSGWATRNGGSKPA